MVPGTCGSSYRNKGVQMLFGMSNFAYATSWQAALMLSLIHIFNEYGFPGDETPIIKGSAYLALTSDSKDPNAPRCV